MSECEHELAGVQRERWQQTYGENPGRYGEEPSEPAVRAAAVFRSAGAREVLELGAGHGRDALYLAREGFTVPATDFSPAGLEQLREAAGPEVWPSGSPDSTLRLLRGMTSPALVVGRFLDVLAWNPLGGALLGEFTRGRVRPGHRAGDRARCGA
ncbi:hypothetical protein [Streptomyces sp. NPDC097610]|uniref:MmyB family transcriptional regulator n=1 Tax=Streptomyces sp. NPDC097610 TaxID=3157227 RepID=UPI00332C33C9